jgi:site-specific DNA recombinase
LLNNEAYIGTVYYNRRESLEGNGPRGARNRKTRHRERPRDEWIPIPVPAIIDRDTFDRVKQISRDNSKWNPRGAEWGVWLLRGLIECGHCHLGCNCHRMRGRNGTWHRYYYCRGHDVLRARSPEGRCPERNIRADELDHYVWAHVRQVLLDPRQLTAGEHAVIAGTPADENELVAAQLKRLDTALDSNERERARLLDAYQAALLDLDELTRRTAALTARRDQLAREKTTLTNRSAELATENRLRRRLAGFAEQVAASLDDLDIDGRRRLLRLVVEKIRVTGWRVEIHLKIPLPNDPPGDDPPPPGPDPDPGPSSDMRLRSVREQDVRVMQ